MLIDSHAHIDLEEFEDDFEDMLKRAKENDVVRIMNVGFDLTSSRRAVSLAKAFPQISAVVGFHPHDAAKVRESDWAHLEAIGRESCVAAIGEMGLDYYRNLSPKDVQKEVFRRQIHLARQLKKPIVIHDRDAHLDVLTMIKEENAGQNGGVMHCFSGSKETARQCMDLGFHISIAGPVTFKNAPRLQDVARYIPKDRLLVETDCPYLAPVPHRGKRNEPAYVKFVAEKIAELKGIPYDQVAEETYRNTVSVFNLKQ